MTTEEENGKLKKQNEELDTKNVELESQVDDLTYRIDKLEADTAELGSSLRQLQSLYDKINELNDILANKNSQLMQESIEENRKLLEELETNRLALQEKEDELDRLATELSNKEADLEKLSGELEQREARVNELETLIENKDAAVDALRQKVADALLGFKDKGLTVEERNGKVYVSLEAKLLFPSGSTKIDSEGKRALIELATAIESQKDLEIVVEGHTDTDKISSSSIPRDNWELSVLRATAVVKIMMENSALDPTILSASGRSAYLPVDPEDKAKNRRIEIILAPNLNELFEMLDDAGTAESAE